MGAFAMALRQGRFLGPYYDTLAEVTVRSTSSFVAQTFREDDYPNQTKDEDGELGRLLSRLFRALKKETKIQFSRKPSQLVSSEK